MVMLCVLWISPNPSWHAELLMCSHYASMYCVRSLLERESYVIYAITAVNVCNTINITSTTFCAAVPVHAGATDSNSDVSR